MNIEVLRLQDLRNYTAAEFRPAPGTTLVAGPNGSGKSSLLEAAGLFSTLASPRAPSLRVLVREGREEGGTHLETDSGASLEVRLKAGRATLRIGGSSASAKDFVGRFRSVLFTPEDLDLVRGEPALRRQAIDAFLTQLRPRYRSVRREFDRALKQRNAALRDGLPLEAELYSEPLARAAAQVLQARREVVSQLGPAAVDLYTELAHRGEIGLTYHDTTEDGGLEGEDLVAHLRDTYARDVLTDIDRGRTMRGPHRDDIEFTLDGRQARWYASRGEQRCVALAVRLAELRLLPGAVLMLDDVLSELDPERRRCVFEVTSGAQTIVSATNADTVPPGAKIESTWFVENGSLQEGEPA